MKGVFISSLFLLCFTSSLNLKHGCKSFHNFSLFLKWSVQIVCVCVCVCVCLCVCVRVSVCLCQCLCVGVVQI